MASDLATWKTAVKSGEQHAGALFKGYAPDTIKAESGGYSFTISTGAVDRDHDTLSVDGWKLDRFRKNPVVLLNHDSRGLPIGKAETVLASGGQLKARVKFADYPLAQTVQGLVDGGFMRATSVGFMPLKWTFNEERGGVDFIEHELLEFSIVSVPSNPEALMDAKSAGVDLGPLKDWATKILDGVEPGLWLPKDVAARALKLASGEPVSVTVKAVSELEAMAEIDAAMRSHEKAGRTLSKANEDRLRSARENLDQVLAAVETDEDDDKAADELVVVKETQPSVPAPPEPVTVEQVSGLIAAGFTAAVRRLQGRLED